MGAHLDKTSSSSKNNVTNNSCSTGSQPCSKVSSNRPTIVVYDEDGNGINHDHNVITNAPGADDPNHNSEADKVGKQVSPPNWLQSVPVPSFSQTDVVLLRQSFEVIKEKREEISLKIMRRIVDGMPEAVEQTKGIWPLTDDWSVRGLGMVVLCGFERCLTRIEQPEKLMVYLDDLLRMHRDKLKVSASMMHQGCVLVEPVILKALKDEHFCHQNNKEICSICKVWSTFLQFLLAVFTAAQHRQELSSNEEKHD